MNAPLPSGDTTGATDAATINALLTEGVRVQLGKALSTAPYWVNASIVRPTHSAISGLGPNITTIKRAADVPVISDIGTNATPLRNLGLYSLTLDANNGQGYVSTLWVQSFTRDRIARDVLLFGAEGVGLYETEVWDAQDDDLLISSCGGNNVATATTATGVNAQNAGTINVGATAAFPAVGIFYMLGAHVSYTGKTATTFTGCSNSPATTGGETIVLSRPAHVMSCSTTDTVNNLHRRGYRNEAYGADGARVAIAVGANIPKNLEFIDQKIEKHGSVGIIDNFQQVQGLYQIGGTMPVTGGLAAGVAQGVDLCSYPGCENVTLDFDFFPGTFLASDVRSFFNFDGSVNAIDKVYHAVKARQGTGSAPTNDMRFAGTVNTYNERWKWNSGHNWTNAHWSASPTSHGGFGEIGRQVISAGTVTYTPTPGTLAILVECIGGGGGGGGTTTAAASAAAGGGGGGGGYSASYILNPGTQAITVAVGTGGLAGNSSGGNGGTGNDTNFNSGVVLGKGGGGGLGQTAGSALLYAAGGGGGLESTGAGDVKLRGGDGQAGVTNTGLIGSSGEGGGGAGALGGGGGVGKVAAGAGVGGGTYGAGGSGGLVLNNSTAVAGGAGGNGLMVITEYGN